MVLKAEVSIPIAVSSAAMVYGIYSVALPNVAEARTSQADDDDLRSAENVATLASAAAVGAIFLVTKDPLPLWYGGWMIVAMAWIHRYARCVDPAIGRIQPEAKGFTEAEYVSGDRGTHVA